MLTFRKDYAQQDYIEEFFSVKGYADIVNEYIANLPWNYRYNYLQGMAIVGGCCASTSWVQPEI